MDQKRMRPHEGGTGKGFLDVRSRRREYTKHHPYPTLPLPPFGKHVTHNLDSVYRNWLYIEAGDNAWTVSREWNKNGLFALVLPEPYLFTEYRWPVRGYDVLLKWPTATASEVFTFGSLLIKSGANCVLHSYGAGTWLYPKAVAA